MPRLSWLKRRQVRSFVTLFAGGILLLPLAASPRPASFIPICAIQGSDEATPYAGQAVTTQGVVFADRDASSKKGFFIQHEACDADPSTSDGIFVYLGSQSDVVSVGDWVEVTGSVQEYYGMTEIVASPGDVTLLSSGNPLPVPVELNPPFDDASAPQYLESREGMYVQLASAVVVGPTDSSDQTWVVNGSLGLGRVFYDDPAGTGEIVCVDDGGLFEISPEATVGDQLTGLAGWLEYSYGEYRLQLLEQPAVSSVQYSVFSEQYSVGVGQSSVGFTFATLNLHDLFDTVDDPATDDDVLTGSAYQRKLQKLALAIHAMGEPTLIGVQEAENIGVLDALAARSEIAADYGAILIEGADQRGIDVGLLYRVGEVAVISDTARQGCTTLADGLGPDGNGDVLNPQNALTCDTDGDSVNDGNWLFSRPPLVAHLTASATTPPLDLWLIINHWKSKTEDTDDVEYTLPRRIEEAQFVAGLVGEILGAHLNANLIVLGDLNDTLASQPLATLSAAGLRNLWLGVDKSSRYSYIRKGVSQELDHVLVSPALDDTPNEFISTTPFHFNADYPASYETVSASERRSSDHDPLVGQYAWADTVYWQYLPVVVRGGKEHRRR